ncbi:hypothetical protein FB451DRAFT_1407819 [Mycena latifolia]|nr:hypothetical protein FB451DRAFT_1407819 [Mycena latifolia]
MLPSKRTLLPAALAAVQSLSYVAVEAHTEDLVITPAPTPTQALAAGQVYPFAVLRGPQFGYSQCGAGSANATADCQTPIVNNAASAFDSLEVTVWSDTSLFRSSTSTFSTGSIRNSSLRGIPISSAERLRITLGMNCPLA